MLSFAKKELKVNLYGREVAMTFPTTKQVNSYQEKIKEGKESDLDLSMNFLVDMGMPEAVKEEIYPQDLETLILTLLGQKKSPAK